MLSFSINSSDVDMLATLIISFLEGGLLGLERYKVGMEKQDKIESEELPGVRTYGLMSILGTILALLNSDKISVSPFANEVLTVSGAIFVTILMVSYIYFRLYRLKIAGLTSYFVFFLTFIIGFLTGYGYYILSMSLTFLIAGILAFKRAITASLEKLSYDELTAGLELGMIIFILGPFVYATNYEIYGLNLQGVYIFFTLILAISYISYMAYKLKGEKSLLAVSLLGGLINSEATLMNILKIGVKGKKLAKLSSINNSGMVIRTALTVLIGAYPFLISDGYEIFARYIISGVLLSIMILYLTYTLSGREKKAEESGEKVLYLASPLEVKIATRGVILYILIFVLVKVSNYYLGSYALFITSFIGGFASSIATVLSLLSLGSTVSIKIISSASLLSMGAAMLNKIIYAKITTDDKDALKEVLVSSIPSGIALIILSLIFIYF
ncbi:MgtC/SapB family protein [Fervidicoccus sp.]|uniref:MgtC/SapB family protein n=1 Tax=Fervidicoccus sp. TaxID=2060324 RepID=UPI003D126A60